MIEEILEKETEKYFSERNKTVTEIIGKKDLYEQLVNTLNQYLNLNNQKNSRSFYKNTYN
jgi:hypothetical protein